MYGEGILKALFQKRPWGLGTAQESSRHRVGTECGIKSYICFEISVLEAIINCSCSTCTHSLLQMVSLKNCHTVRINSCEESIHGEINPPGELMLIKADFLQFFFFMYVYGINAQEYTTGSHSFSKRPPQFLTQWIKDALKCRPY